MAGLETSGNNLPDEFIMMILGIRLAPGGRSQIIYKELPK